MLGILAARIAVSVLVAHGPGDIPRLADAAPDAIVLGFAVLIAGITTFIFGILPLVFASGAGAASRHSLGTAVCGGTTSACF